MLDELYDDLLRASVETVDVRRHVVARMRSWRFVLGHLRDLSQLRELTVSPLFLRTPPQQRLLVDALADLDLRRTVVRAALDPAPLIVLAADLCGRYKPTVADVAQIKALHKTRVRVTATGAPRPVLAGVVGLGAVVGALIPEEVFTYFRWSAYPLYRTVIAVGTVIMLLYAAVSLAPAYMAYRRRSIVDTIATELIEHIEATLAQDSE